MRWGAVGVLGNNDYALVAAYDTLQRDPNSEAARRIVESTPMSEASLEWLRSLPLAMRFPKHNLIVVHAGVIPGSTPEVRSCIVGRRYVFFRAPACVEYEPDVPRCSSMRCLCGLQCGCKCLHHFTALAVGVKQLVFPSSLSPPQR